MRDSILQTILSKRAVVNISGIYEHDCLELMAALKIGGASVFSITIESIVDYQKVVNSLKMARQQFGTDILVGINNVTSVDMVRQLGQAGAQFVMSPNTKKDMIQAAHDEGMVSVSGAMTPNEIIEAHNSGADIVHVYPARWLGPAYFNYTCKLLEHIHVMTSGGIDRNNMRLYMNAGVDVVLVDDCLFSIDQLAKKEWCTIAEAAQNLINTVVRR